MNTVIVEVEESLNKSYESRRNFNVDAMTSSLLVPEHI